jgi:hypothetical protein
MNDFLRFAVGIAVIISLVGVYGYLAFLGQYKRAKEKQVKEDKAEFGYCCGLEDGVCTFQPRLDKLNKIDLDAAKKEPDKK